MFECNFTSNEFNVSFSLIFRGRRASVEAYAAVYAEAVGAKFIYLTEVGGAD